MNAPASFHDYLRSVVRRLKLQKAIRQGGWALGIISLLLLVLAGSRFFTGWPIPLSGVVLLMMALGLAILAGLMAYILPVPFSTAARVLDHHNLLPDSAISSLELEGDSQASLREAWKQAQIRDTWKRLEGESLPKVRWNALALGSVIFAAALVLTLWPHKNDSEKTEAKENVATLPEAAKLDLLFQDWEEAAAETDDAALKELLKAIEPFRKELQQGEPSLQSVFVQLSKIDERLSSAEEALKASSLDTQTGKIADALRQVGGLEALAERMQERAYEQAAQAAQQASEELTKNGTGQTPAALSASARKSLQSLSGEMVSNQQMSNALQQLSASQTAEEISEALQQMSESLKQESSRQQRQRQAALQRMQVASAKEALEKGQPAEAGLSLVPKLSLEKKEGEGKGAGAENNSNRWGALNSATPEGAPPLPLKGTADALGESTVSTVRAPSAPRLIAPTQEGLAPADYQRLSLQAIEDENLPLAHRLAIRRYFEMIRAVAPTSETP